MQTTIRFAAFLLLALSAAAQVPDGWAVVGTSKNNPSSLNPGPGGLWLVDPRAPGPPVAVTGLACELTGTCGSPARGVTDVRIRADGKLVVGELGPQGEMIDLHVITLAGSAVASDVKIPIGSPSGGSGSVRPLGIYPDGRVLVSAANALLQPQGTHDSLWGIVDPESGVTQPIEHPILLGTLGSAATRELDAVYYARFEGQGSGVYRLAIPAGGTPVLVATLPDLVRPQYVEASGILVATESAAYPTKLYRIDPATGAFTVVALDLAIVTALEPLSAPGSDAQLAGALDGPPSHLYRIEACVATLVSSGPPDGWGNIQGLAVAPEAPVVYCAPTTSSHGCTPALATSGSLAGGDLAIAASGVEGGVLGLFFYSLDTAPAATPFAGGLLCSDPPFVRTPAQPSGGAAGTCSGALSIAWSASVGPHVPAGSIARGQFWYRDPSAPGGSQTTAAVELTDL
jgi:hypothetical protein